MQMLCLTVFCSFSLYSGGKVDRYLPKYFLQLASLALLNQEKPNFICIFGHGTTPSMATISIAVENNPHTQTELTKDKRLKGYKVLVVVIKEL